MIHKLLTKEHKFYSVFMLFMVTLLAMSSFISTDIYLPSFPSMVSFFSVKPSAIQLSLTLYTLAFAFSSFFFGILSDRFGRKPILMIGISIFIFGSVLTLDTNSINYLYIGRILQGFGIGTASTLSRIILRDQFKGDQLSNMFSWIAVVVSLVPAVAPFIGGYLQENFNFLGSLWFMLLYGILIFAIVCFCLPETNSEKSRDATNINQLKKQLKNILTNKCFVFSVLTNGAMLSLIICYSLVSPFIFQQHFDYTPTQYGLTILFVAFGMVVGVIINRILRKVLSVQFIITLGIIIALTMDTLIFGLALTHNITPYRITVLLFLANAGTIMVMPNNASIAFSLFKSGIGTIGALYGALRMLIATLIGFFIPILHLVNSVQMGLALMVIGMIALTLTLLNRTSQNNHLVN